MILGEIVNFPKKFLAIIINQSILVILCSGWLFGKFTIYVGFENKLEN